METLQSIQMKNTIPPKFLISLILNRVNSCSLKFPFSCLKTPLLIFKSSLSLNRSTKFHHIRLTIYQNFPSLRTNNR